MIAKNFLHFIRALVAISAITMTLTGCQKNPTTSSSSRSISSIQSLSTPNPTSISPETASANVCNPTSDLINGECIARPVCDGTTDDTAVLQKRIDKSAGGSLVIAATSAPCVVTGLTVTSNSNIQINATIQLKANSTRPTDNQPYGAAGSVQDIINTPLHSSNISITGSGSLDGNRDHQNGTCCGAGITSGYSQNLSFSGLTIKNVVNWPVNIVVSTGAKMANMTLYDSGNSVEFAAGTSNCSATGLRIFGINDMGFSFYGGVSNCSLTNSVTSNNASDGVSILNDSAQPALSHDITIDNVESFSNASNGFVIATNDGVVGSSYNIKINNSRSHDNTARDVSNPSGTNVSIDNLTTAGTANIYTFNNNTTITNTNTTGSVATAVTGIIDGVMKYSTGQYYIGGWACTLFNPNSLPAVALYVKTPGATTTTGIAWYPANLASEPQVATACKSSGSAYRFEIPLSANFVNQYKGSTIYIYGISPWKGFPNNELSNSGTYTIPNS